MISGPTLPGTRDAVWHLVQHRVDRLESGLKLAFHDLEVAPGVVIDGLCRDAATHPVAVLAAVASDGDSFVGQILAVRRFLREQAEGLGELLPEVRIQFTGQARVMVVGLEISAALRDAVEPLGGDGVELFQLHSVRLGGELRWMVQPVTGPQAGQARTAAGGPQTVPGGVLDPRQQGLCATFLRIAERLDPSVILRGDRFGRRVLCNGEQLAALSYIEGRLQVAFRDGAEVELLTEEDAMSAGDRLIRDFLAAAGVWKRRGCGGRATRARAPRRPAPTRPRLRSAGVAGIPAGPAGEHPRLSPDPGGGRCPRRGGDLDPRSETLI